MNRQEFKKSSKLKQKATVPTVSKRLLMFIDIEVFLLYTKIKLNNFDIGSQICDNRELGSNPKQSCCRDERAVFMRKQTTGYNLGRLKTSNDL